MKNAPPQWAIFKLINENLKLLHWNFKEAVTKSLKEANTSFILLLLKRVQIGVTNLALRVSVVLNYVN